MRAGLEDERPRRMENWAQFFRRGASVGRVTDFEIRQSPALHTHVLRHDAKSFGLDLADGSASERMRIANPSTPVAIEERRENEAVAVTVGTNEQHRAADGLEPNERLSAQIAHVLATAIAPGVAIEAFTAIFGHAVRLDDVFFVGHEPLKNVRRVVDDIHIEPKNPVFVPQRSEQEMIASAGEHRSTRRLICSGKARGADRDVKAEILAQEMLAREGGADVLQSPRNGIVCIVPAVALEYSERQAAVRVGQPLNSCKICVEILHGGLHGC
jgi:hypothetical protein